MSNERFTLIFAVDIASRETVTGAQFAASLARIVPDHGIQGFTVWPSHGYTVDYGREAGATVEFVAPVRRAVAFAADIAKYYGQDAVYLANGTAAVIVDYRGYIEPLTSDNAFAGAPIHKLNTETQDELNKLLATELVSLFS